MDHRPTATSPLLYLLRLWVGPTHFGHFPGFFDAFPSFLTPVPGSASKKHGSNVQRLAIGAPAVRCGP